MSLQAILNEIRASYEIQIREIEAGANARMREILAEADEKIREVREEARAKASAPAGKERARILHRAHLEGLHIVGNVRESLVNAALERARARLANLRAEQDYPAVLRRLTEEALVELDNSSAQTAQGKLQADQRDRPLLEKILGDMGLDLEVDYSLKCSGGLISRSADDQVVVINTLEARFERAVPPLRHLLASMFEDEQTESVPVLHPLIKMAEPESTEEHPLLPEEGWE